MKRTVLLSILLFSFIFQMYSQDTVFVPGNIKFELVKNINTMTTSPGVYDGSSYPRNLTVAGGQLFFGAAGDSVGYELFVTDGTESGTHLVKNINRHRQSSGFYDDDSHPYALTVFGDKLLFAALDYDHGYEPWITDGSPEGTTIVKDIYGPYPGNNPSSYPEGYTLLNGKIYFQADEGMGGELYVTDGTEQGTFMVKNICTSGLGDGNPSNFMVFNSKLYFCAAGNYTGDELWCSDGTEAGTYMVKDIGIGVVGYPTSLFVFHDKLYFSAESDSIGRELWCSDGTEAGTVLCCDINKMEGMGSFPAGFAVLNDKLFFRATDGVNGPELWCTDGDTVYMVKDISPTTGACAYSEFFEYKNKLYFNARMTENYVQGLWVTDGTGAGTYELLASDSTLVGEPNGFIIWHDQLLFKAQQQFTSNTQIWITDGTLQNTRQLFPDSVSGWSPNLSDMVLFNDEIYMGAGFDQKIGAELYKLVVDTTGNANSIESESLAYPVRVYPNPVGDELVLEFADGDPKQLDLTDLNGRIVYSNAIKSDRVRINTSGLPRGMYLLRVRTSETSFTHRVIKI
jgi:ELWxxDGT repeat protein